ncbi:polyamine oxidase 3-like [Actinia tenebrosa]|uniref:Polyamine oxidase 3-like n=1 Tax=Actinia tenebrosa TaxID=6105 RepID=A0A6P8HQE4_ACTTE|nr:polyamine oxidase 3-like [Actinia tenebrosa]
MADKGAENKNKSENVDGRVRVAVIGGGISGLAAASSLVQERFDVVLLEASDYIGGRIKTVTAFPGFPPIDLGADFIHGSNSIINKLAEENNWTVKQVCVDKKKDESVKQTPEVVITSRAGETLAVDYVVVTVPLTILKDGDIIFSPPLPPKKQHAINTIQMGAALKIVCRFRIPFWREKTLIFPIRGFLSQIWTYSRDPKEDGEECHVGVGFATAALAAQKAHLFDEEVCEQFLQQLDEIFGTDADPKPATNNFISFVYEHWSRHPYVRGGYSTQTVDTYGLKQHLSAPVEGRLFFAGEATSLMLNATVQSAIGTGMRAAREVCEAAQLNVERKIVCSVRAPP